MANKKPLVLTNGIAQQIQVADKIDPTVLGTGSPDSTNFLRGDGAWVVGGQGSVTSVSVTTANGVSGSVANATTTPAITLTLGNITPSSVASTGALSGTTGQFSQGVGIGGAGNPGSSGLAVNGTSSFNNQLTINSPGTAISANTPILVTNNGNPSFVLNSTGANYGLIRNVSADNWALSYGASYTSGGNDVLKWNTTGVAVTGTLSATGTITSTVNAGLYITTPASTAGYGALIRMQKVGVDKGFIGHASNLFNSTSDDLVIYPTTGANTLICANNSATPIGTFSSTGLAVTGTLSATTGGTIGSGGTLGSLLNIAKSNAGTSVDVGIFNSDSTNGASNAQLRIYTNGANSGDPIVNWEVNGVTRYYMGIDNSNSDKLVIGSGYAPGSSDYLTIDGTGLAVTGAITATSGSGASIFYKNGGFSVTQAGSNSITTGNEGAYWFNSGAGSYAAIVGNTSNAMDFYVNPGTWTKIANISSTGITTNGIFRVNGFSSNDYFQGVSAGISRIVANGGEVIRFDGTAGGVAVTGAITATNTIQATANVGFSMLKGVGNSGAIISITSNTSGSGINFYSYNLAQNGYEPLNYYASSHIFKGTGAVTLATIDTSGNLLVGTTSALGPDGTNKRLVVSETNTGGQLAAFISGYTGGAQNHINVKTSFNGSDGIAFYNAASTKVGGITINASTTAYNTSSDYRLKENILPMKNALATVALLKPCTYTWKADGSSSQGFIAHELQEIVPDCVTGKKDAVDDDGNPIYQGVDTSFLIATLTAAVQEQQAIIESLVARVAALEKCD